MGKRRCKVLFVKWLGILFESLFLEDSTRSLGFVVTAGDIGKNIVGGVIAA